MVPTASWEKGPKVFGCWSDCNRGRKYNRAFCATEGDVDEMASILGALLSE